MNRLLMAILALIVLLMASNYAFANPIDGNTCGQPDRYASLDGAAKCAYGNDNPDAGTIAGYYGDVWSFAGELTADGTDKYLSATSNAGWGLIPNSGTWAIDAGFWGLYDKAVITMHIGNGAGDPDHWAWLIIDDTLNGTWNLDYIDGGTGKGGGLSNIKLWGVRGNVTVPEPGSIALLGLGLLGFAAARRRKA